MTSTIDTGTPELLAHVDGQVGVITLNRPERRNALSAGIYEGLRVALPEFAKMSEVRVVMMTGAGNAFCAGGDVKAMNEANQSGSDRAAALADVDGFVTDLRARQREISLAIHQHPKPVVAAIPGPVAGAGLSIALAADIRLAAERSIFVTAFSGVAGSGDFGGSWFLTQLVGTAKARELYFMSPRLSAADALDLGIVNHVFADDEFAAAALDWCHTLALRAPIAVRLMKENLNRAIVSDLATALDAEAPNMVRSMRTADHKEATAAFVEKRTPVFSGR